MSEGMKKNRKKKRKFISKWRNWNLMKSCRKWRKTRRSFSQSKWTKPDFMIPSLKIVWKSLLMRRRKKKQRINSTNRWSTEAYQANEGLSEEDITNSWWKHLDQELRKLYLLLMISWNKLKNPHFHCQMCLLSEAFLIWKKLAW